MALTPSQARELFATLTPAEVKIRRARQAWTQIARAEQMPPDGGGNWLVMAGRGFGKTRAGAEAVVKDMIVSPGIRVAIVGQTLGDAREVAMEGESGVLGILHRYGLRESNSAKLKVESFEYHWNRWNGELFLANGSMARLYTSERPDKLRGPQHHVVWFDELAAFQQAQNTWDMAMFGLRLGLEPHWYVTTTPRPTETVREAMQQAHKVSRGSTFDNSANLPDLFLNRLRARYDGTRLGRQELYAEMLDDVPGALWTRNQIDACRVWEVPAPGTLRSAVVGLDPSDATNEGDEFGLAVAGFGWDNQIYVVESMGLVDGPVESLRTAVKLARKWNARIVVEKNHGGAYLIATLEQVLREEDVRVPYETVHASDSKRTRAEPIAALYEQNKVHHLGVFAGLEDQLCDWVPGMGDSPDRADALVWAVTPFLGFDLNPSGGIHADSVAGYKYGDTTYDLRSVAGATYWDLSNAPRIDGKQLWLRPDDEPW